MWLLTLEVEYNRGYNEREIRDIAAIVAENRERWIGVWNEFFGI